MKQLSVQRALRFLACATVLIGLFEACSGDDSSTPTGPSGPPSLEIASISLGQGSVGEGGASSVLACDHTVGVRLTLSNWTLRPPGYCSTPQCGQVHVTLVDAKGALLVSQVAASQGVDLKLSSDLVKMLHMQQPTGSYLIQAELVDDAGKPFVATDGGNGSAQRAFFMALPDCSNPDGGAAANPGAAGAAGANAAAGAPGLGGAGDSAGGDSAGGDSAGGDSGTTEAAGSGGV